MLTQAIDFRDESETLYQLLASREDVVFSSPSQFKGWTLNDILVHLHMWNKAADWSLHEPGRFDEFMQEVLEARPKGETHQTVAYRWLGGARACELLEVWHVFYLEMSERFAAAEGGQRVKWAGPDMTVAMSITAR